MNLRNSNWAGKTKKSPSVAVLGFSLGLFAYNQVSESSDRACTGICERTLIAR